MGMSVRRLKGAKHFRDPSLAFVVHYTYALGTDSLSSSTTLMPLELMT